MFDSTRIVWGLVMFAAFVLVMLINSFILNFVIIALLLYFAFNESKKLFNLDSNIILVAIAFLIGTFFEEALLCGILAFILMLGYLAFIKADSLKPALIYLYPVIPILALWQVYLDNGIFVVFWLILSVICCDSGAYFIGKMIGNTPFSKTSPKKTMEGVIGGILVATFIGMLVGLYEFSFFKSLILSFLVAVFAVIGDLIESYFKRVADIKDSSELIPGHGGILDRIDAIIIASFVMVAFA
ncbi:phosphatidate cytidylyltransferase [Campylobacter sp. LR264d]|uniref:phosphatidate cytidylyltransferase n=1 Tax=Campylobacter sp. LR264d TaxID=2593544 RepID=UPI0012392C87|nr:phosphatidate cytidylyltransferase [Campylobacter sp. LR264d]KAA6229608.1 phosphatidate cytidylyltransferase [Campylobacter sp. LR264d]